MHLATRFPIFPADLKTQKSTRTFEPSTFPEQTVFTSLYDPIVLAHATATR